MSQENSNWLNNMTLIGFTEKRGHAWHYRKEDQGAEPNHYPGAIPLDDVTRRLFNFEVVEQPLTYQFNGKTIETDRKLMVCSDNGDLLGVFKSGYQGHQYQEWLLKNVATILSGDLGIGSAGLLKNRGQAWVSVEVPETIKTPEGVEFRPNLLACTSFDGTLTTTYKRVVTAVVCDNTLAASLGEKDQTYKLKHSKYSVAKIKDAREALAIVYTMADDFASEVTRLTSWEVTEKQFLALLHQETPIAEDASKRAKTISEKKRAEIVNLYTNDVRAATWNGTAYGVLQAYNTWNHHFSTVRGEASRVVRNMENVLTAQMAQKDADVLDKLAVVCAA